MHAVPSSSLFPGPLEDGSPTVETPTLRSAEQLAELRGEPAAVEARAENAGREKPISDVNELPVMLTVNELAALMRVDKKTIYALIAQGDIPGVRRLGRAIRLHRDTALRWLAEGQVRGSRSKRFR